MLYKFDPNFYSELVKNGEILRPANSHFHIQSINENIIENKQNNIEKSSNYSNINTSKPLNLTSRHQGSTQGSIQSPIQSPINSLTKSQPLSQSKIIINDSNLKNITHKINNRIRLGDKEYEDLMNFIMTIDESYLSPAQIQLKEKLKSNGNASLQDFKNFMNLFQMIGGTNNQQNKDDFHYKYLKYKKKYYESKKYNENKNN